MPFFTLDTRNRPKFSRNLLWVYTFDFTIFPTLLTNKLINNICELGPVSIKIIILMIDNNKQCKNLGGYLQ